MDWDDSKWVIPGEFGNEPHPESVDPVWFQELVRRAFDRELRKLQAMGVEPEEAYERSMWYVFDLRLNLTELYKAGKEDTNEL